MKLNPAYVEAPFQLNVVTPSGRILDDPMPHRFNEPWPEDITPSALLEWVRTHSIPPEIP